MHIHEKEVVPEDTLSTEGMAIRTGMGFSSCVASSLLLPPPPHPHTPDTCLPFPGDCKLQHQMSQQWPYRETVSLAPTRPSFMSNP